MKECLFLILLIHCCTCHVLDTIGEVDFLYVYSGSASKVKELVHSKDILLGRVKQDFAQGQ